MDNSYDMIKHRGHGHMRSASLENANSILAKNTLGLPNVFNRQQQQQQQQNQQQQQQPQQKQQQQQQQQFQNQPCFMTGTLKSNFEQKRSLRNKFGSYNNLDEYGIHNKSKFQNLKNMFEMKIDYGGTNTNNNNVGSTTSTNNAGCNNDSNNGGINNSRIGRGGEGNYIDSSVINPSKNLKNPQIHQQQHQQQQQQQRQMNFKSEHNNQIHHHQQYQQQQQQQQPQQQHHQQQQQQKLTEFHDNCNLNITESSSSLSNEAKMTPANMYQAKNLLKPIAFKPIPFEPDYSIPNRYVEFCDRYGSTPSLAPVQGTNMKFGSTSDLRHGYSYCANLARRRCVRSFKINDSMESISHTPDSDQTSQNNTIKLMNKYPQDQFDTTPSPSDSGISELEAALKDRDSELSYLRQTMEHNEKDKEVYWEQETKRLKNFYENQQKEHLAKVKKLEQMLTLQSFQFKQNRLRFSEDSNRLREQFNDLKNENELLRNEADGLKTSEKTMRDRVNQLEQKVDVMDKLILNLKSQLEENEWTVCQKNGEIALLKTQLKETKIELTSKELEIVHMKTEIQNKADEEEQIYSSSIRDEFKSDTEKSQLNRIIILKDQVILALTNELAKLRKELSELAITHEYGEEPTGKYTRLKYKIENLTNIWQNRHQEQQQIQQLLTTENHLINDTNTSTNTIDNSDKLINNDTGKSITDTKMNTNKNLEENDLEIIINCLKTPMQFNDHDQDDGFNDNNVKFLMNAKDTKFNDTANNQNAMTSITTSNHNNKSSFILTGNDCNKTIIQNLPDVTQNSVNNILHNNNNNRGGDKIIDDDDDSKVHLIQNELDEVRKTFELEKRQWAEEKEKVLKYQRQLQTHYIHMYQKMKDLENQLSKKF